MTLLAYLIAVLVLLPASYGAVYGGSRALHHWQHGRCLARIEKLEREVYVIPSADLASPTTAAHRYRLSAQTARRPTYQQPKPRNRGKRGMWYGS